MDSDENQEPPQPLPLPLPLPLPHHSPSSHFPLKPILLLSILIALLAILFNFTNPTYFYRFYPLKSILSFHSYNFLASQKPNPPKFTITNPTSPYCVLWMAPFLSGGGYISEAWSYILALTDYMNKKGPTFKLSIEQHGDLENLEFWEGLSLDMRDLAVQLHENQCRLNETVVVCHSEPGAWFPPLFQTLPCPPTGYGGFKAVIGRTMFETDRVNDEHVKRCNRMDFVWVPTDFHVKTFTESGVEPSKVVKIVQPVDVEFFDPRKYSPLDLSSIGTLVLGSKSRRFSWGRQFVFLSVFKWEYRKGWDVLLKAYLNEFSAGDGVGLYLLTNPYHSDRDFGNKIVDFIKDLNMNEPVNGWAPIYVINDHIPQVDLPRLYKAADAFVLPSRGEGWGRPLVEAMAMSLPVIATNWSGPTEFLTEENSYPVPMDSMEEVLEGPFSGHLWAEPSVSKLQLLMRDVARDRENAKAIGWKARDDMIGKFSPDIVAQIVTEQIQQVINM